MHRVLRPAIRAACVILSCVPGWNEAVKTASDALAGADAPFAGRTRKHHRHYPVSAVLRESYLGRSSTKTGT